MVYLQEPIHLKLGDVLKHSDSRDIFLDEHRFNLLWLVYLLEDGQSLLHDLIVDEVNAQGKTSELLFDLRDDVSHDYK